MRMRDVDCVTIHDRYLDMNNKTHFNITILDDSACNNSRRPDELIPCNEYPCFFQWRAGQFGPVSFCNTTVADFYGALSA